MSDLYAYISEDKTKCNLCPHGCIIKTDSFGKCGARVNVYGKILSTGYGRISSMSIDRIEKKPLFHFKPGKNILSVGSIGCNFSCKFCQNYSISRENPLLYSMDKFQLIERILNTENSIGIAFTYNEPLINYEYIMDIASNLKKNHPGKSVVLVTNGYINSIHLERLLDYVDAVNLDIKSMEDGFYREVCDGSLEPVLRNVEIFKNKCHLEVTNLIIEGYNDSSEQVTKLCEFLSEIDENIPLHFSKSFPAYKMKNICTKEKSVISAIEIGKRYLNYVYGGNLTSYKNDTLCKKCGRTIIERDFNGVRINEDKDCLPKHDNNIVY